MRRRQWIEIHEQPWFPNSLRNFVTDALQIIWNVFSFYEPIAPRLRYTLQEAGTRQVLDLCSGGGGPWLGLVRDFERERFSLDVCLTDKFPNPEALKHAKNLSRSGVVFHDHPVNATCVPGSLKGFRTLFNSFHHFPPEEARAILQDAVKNHEGVGIFEIPKRDWITILLVLLIPLMALALVPFIRPFRWSRLLWAYLIPVGLFVVWFDGVISCLRAYSPPELRALARGLSQDGYDWEAGEERKGRIPLTITYLIGYPTRVRDNRTPSLDLHRQSFCAMALHSRPKRAPEYDSRSRRRLPDNPAPINKIDTLLRARSAELTSDSNRPPTADRSAGMNRSVH